MAECMLLGTWVRGKQKRFSREGNKFYVSDAVM